MFTNNPLSRRRLAMLLACLIPGGLFAAGIDLQVALDGSAKFKSVQEAIMSVPAGTREAPVVIHIAPGTYHELLYIQREKRFFKLVGDNATNTILTFNLYAGITNAEGKPIGTFHTPSTTIDADDFTAENITFANDAGPVGQALAIRVDGDRAAFHHCQFLGWQDTILLNRGRQYFDNCHIEGHVDFIFGAATAWFEQCRIVCLRDGYVTAASTPADAPYGFVFNRCKIAGANPDVQTWLGRPWRINASTIYLNCELSDAVRPPGWNDWNKPEAHTHTRYAEYHSTGAGANPTNRPAWTKQLTDAEAQAITVQRVLGGTDDWDPTLTYNLEFAPNHKNVVYGKAGGQKLLLDVWEPADEAKHPVALIVHGGGWSSGDKAHDISVLFEPLARAGYTWFSIDYRLAPTNRWPAQLDDLQTAIRWVKKHAADYKGDPDRIAMFGYSAGGQMVSLAGVLPTWRTHVQAVIGLAPPNDLVADNVRRGGLSKSMQMLFHCDSTNITPSVRAVLAKNSPIDHVKPGLPPFLLIQGDADKTVMYEHSRNFQSKLKAAGDVCDFIVIPGGGHRILDWDKFEPTWTAQMTNWLGQNLKGK